MRREPGYATRGIPRRCGTCKFWHVDDAGTGWCEHPSRPHIPHSPLRICPRPEDGERCPLWQPIQSEVRRA